MRARLTRRWTPALAAFVIAPAATELLSGNTPPLAFFNPVVFALFALLYGGGAILAHDLTTIRGRGWPSLLALGIAYGIFEEAIVTRAWFNPEWPDLAAGGDFARWLDTSWIQAIRLTAYHTVFAILIPILLVRLAFPHRRETPWLSPKRRRVLAVAFVSLAPLGFLIMPYRPPVMLYVTAWTTMIVLVALAAKLPNDRRAARAWNTSRRRTILTGFAAAAGLFLLGWVIPALSTPPVISVPLLIGGICFVAWFMMRARPGQPELTLLVAGALGWWVAAAPLLELMGRRGMLLVSIAGVLLLRRLARGVRGEDIGSGACNLPLTFAAEH